MIQKRIPRSTVVSVKAKGKREQAVHCQDLSRAQRMTAVNGETFHSARIVNDDIYTISYTQTDPVTPSTHSPLKILKGSEGLFCTGAISASTKTSQ